jgi:hypothetical protein
MANPSEAPGITERWFARAARGGWLVPGPARGTLTLALAAVASSCAAAIFLALNARSGSVVVTLAAAWAGGMAASRAAWPGVAPDRRAWTLVLNLISEGVIVVAAAFWARAHQNLPGPLAAGFLALSGALMLGYTRTRIQASAGSDPADGPWGIAAREVRLLILAVGIAVGQPYWALIVIAALGHGAVAGHLHRLRGTLHG